MYDFPDAAAPARYILSVASVIATFPLGLTLGASLNLIPCGPTEQAIEYWIVGENRLGIEG